MTDRRRLALAGAVLVGVTGLLAAAGLQWGELGLTEAINNLPEPAVDALALVMQLGTRPAILVVAAVTVVVADVDWRRTGLVVVLAGGLAWAGASVGKDVVERPRPAAYSQEIEVRGGATNSGWPSSHTAIAAGTLTAAALSSRRDPGAALVLATVVGVGRMAVGLHLPLDVLGGLGVGVACAAVVSLLADR